MLAPAVNMLFRPEQEHGASGENYIPVPMAGRNREVKNPLGRKKFAAADLDRHVEVAAATCRSDLHILI